ncbi:MAG TPA: hypothetical protein GXX36_14045, partial [Clostridiaceae bacterium]|nr:hypothetical protein [Clostridiaceae bacterium]
MARRKNMKVVSIFILAIFVFTLVCPIAAFAEETMENIAYKKPATCSDPPDIASKTHTPELAVDGIGNEYGNGCSLESSLIMEGAWLQIDLEGEYVIKRIEMDDRVGDDWDGPRKNFVFRASNDPNFETYVNLCEPVTEEFENDTTWSCEVTDPNGYRYIRFVKLVQSYQFIPEIRVFGVPSGSGQEPEPEPEDEIAFYVSSDGNDSNDGSIDSPFLTIERARDAVRQINSDMDKDITVYLRGGEYKIEDTIEFNSTDSGTNGYYITYRNYPGETPVLSGGESIDGWVQEGSLFKTNIGAGTKIRELFVNGQRAQRARSQSFKIRAWNSGEKLFAIDKDAVAEWAEVDPNMEVVILQHWVLNYFKLGSYSTDGDYVWIGVNGKGNKVKDFYSDPYPAKDVDTSVHFENSLMYLDRPGEWCLVESTGDVYYYPREGETLQNLKAVTPGIETIMKLTGTSTNNRIKNIRIQGISFEYTKWQEYIDEDGVIPQQADMTEYRTVNRPPAVIFIDCAENLKIERNVIRHTANAGIDIYTKSINNEITGNVLLDIGSNGIQEGLFNESGARTLTVQGNKIRNNYLKGISVTSSGCGIVCGYTNGVVIEHNEISDCAYTGISVGWGWTNNSTALGNNKINYNHIYNVVNKLSDGGAIYTLSRAPGSEIIGNYIHDIDRSEWCSRSAAATIYLDQESRGFRVADNVFRRVGQTLNGSTVIDPENTVENNDSQDQDIIDNAGLEPEYMDIVPGIISHKSGADWISPERCSVIISGNVALKEEGSSLEVSILKNGEEIWSGTVDSTSGISYHKNIDVEEGDVISFKAMNGDTPADGLVSWDSLISIQEYPPLLTMEISFSPDQLGEAGEVLEYKTDYYSKRITIRVGEDVDVKNLVPTIVTPPGTVVEPASGVARDFSDIVKYTVWMEEGSKYTDFDGSRKFKVWDVAVIKEQSATVVRGYNINDVISDEDNWEVTGGTKTATDNSITFTEGIATYTGRTFLNELLEFNLNISSGGWPSIVFRMKNHDTIYNPGNEGYIICIKEDQIELQRFNDGERTVFYGNIGESPSKYGDSVPNNEGLFAYGKDHHVQVGAMNVDDGVRLLMYIDGKKVFDCIDNFEG